MTTTPTSKRFQQLLSARELAADAAQDEPDAIMPAPPAAAASNPQTFKLRGGSYTLLVLNLVDLHQPNFFQWLLEKIAQAPNFYRDAPVVLDLQGLSDSGPFNFAGLIKGLRDHHLIPVGIQNGTEEQSASASAAGLSVFPMWRESRPIKEARSAPTAEQAQAAQAPSKPVERGSKIVSQPIRSGRQIYAQNGDLVVLATASAGSELLADGSIHVYGALRGRALAGVSGDTSARIFCQCLQAELVSIAGHWLVREDMDDRLIGRPAQIFLKGELLVLEPLRS